MGPAIGFNAPGFGSEHQARVVIANPGIKYSLDTLVVILEPHDVIFTQIIAKLHLNDGQKCVAAISQPMIGLWRNVDVLALAKLEFPLTADDICNALDHDPMFASSCMSLQTQPRAWLYFK
jgi:hypothetical protein